MDNAVRKIQDHLKLYTIGQVLGVLKPEFSDLSPSKLRFLEDQGLITPDRTDSGYRKYSESQIERIRIILTLQRDQYLPLKVIRDYLDEIDAGRQPLLPPTNPGSLRKGQRFSTAQLKAETGLGDLAFREGRNSDYLVLNRTLPTRLKLLLHLLALSNLEFSRGT